MAQRALDSCRRQTVVIGLARTILTTDLRTRPSEEVLPATGKSKTEIAKLLGISWPSLYDILDCKQPITPQTTVRIGKLCGNGPRLWFTMQTAHDLWDDQRTVDVSKIPTLEQV